MTSARLKASPQNVVERNLELTQEIMSYLLQHPQMLDSLPENFELVILPHDDPDPRQYNLDLLDKYGSDGKPVVLARTGIKKDLHPKEVRPNIYVPLSA